MRKTKCFLLFSIAIIAGAAQESPASQPTSSPTFEPTGSPTPDPNSLCIDGDMFVYERVEGVVEYEAQALCSKRGGNLASFKNCAEYMLVAEMVVSDSAFIGLNARIPPAGTTGTNEFTNRDKTTEGLDFFHGDVGKFPWAPDMPLQGGGRDCACVAENGLLYNRPCGEHYPSICRVVDATECSNTSPASPPTPKLTVSPIVCPTAAPTESPTTSPTKNSTTSPTESPTTSPTKNSTTSPTKDPTTSPTKNPTIPKEADESDSSLSNFVSSASGIFGLIVVVGFLVTIGAAVWLKPGGNCSSSTDVSKEMAEEVKGDIRVKQDI